MIHLPESHRWQNKEKLHILTLLGIIYRNILDETPAGMINIVTQ